MLGNATKKEAVKELEKISKENTKAFNLLVKNTELLYEKQLEANEMLYSVERIINQFTNTPKSFTVYSIKNQKYLTGFNEKLEKAKEEYDKLYDKAGNLKAEGGAVGGILIGAGVGALGPSAAMAFATAFGTASTGTAISSLSGIVATKAALAWLGGGALSAGGAGVIGGKALLGMAGPVGWTIAGVAVAGGCVYKYWENNEITKKAFKEIEQCKKNIDNINLLKTNVNNKIESIILQMNMLDALVKDANDIKTYNFKNLTKDQKLCLGSIVNTANSLIATLEKSV